ncbi:MAG: hypothetical protein M9921_08130 [Fimbriimonadaceae bacterium]|nr:hypothetical protein [Fimbriimonadaceae bacterium]
MDHVSLCGNCYAGVTTQSFEVEFEGSERIKLKPVGPHRSGRVERWYRRETPTPELRDAMQRRVDKARSEPSPMGDDYFFASDVLDAIDHLAPELATSKEGMPIARR